MASAVPTLTSVRTNRYEMGRTAATMLIDAVEGILRNGSQPPLPTKSHALTPLTRTQLEILRLAAAEILYFDDVPPKVTINEAVEIAKKQEKAKTKPLLNVPDEAIVRALAVAKEAI